MKTAINTVAAHLLAALLCICAHSCSEGPDQPAVQIPAKPVRTEAVTKLAVAGACGYTVRDISDDGENITLMFENHPVMDEYASEYPEGMEELRLSREKDGIKEVKIRQWKDVTFLLDTGKDIRLQWHSAISTDWPERIDTLAVPGQVISIPFRILEETTGPVTIDVKAPQDSRAEVKLDQLTGRGELTCTMTDRPLRILVDISGEIASVQRVIDCGLHSFGSDGDVIELSGAEEAVTIPYTTTMTAEHRQAAEGLYSLLAETSAGWIDIVSVDEEKCEIHALIEENLTFEDRTATLSLSMDGNTEYGTAWTITQQVMNEKEDGFVWFECLNFRKAVIQAGHDTDRDGKISMEEAEAIERLEVAGKDIESLTGIEHMSGLKYLDISENPFSVNKAVDLSGPHHYLTDVRCDAHTAGKLSFDFSGCPSVVWVHDVYGIPDITAYAQQTIYQLPNGAHHDRYKIVEDRYVSTDFTLDRKETLIMKHTRGEGVEVRLHYYGMSDKDCEAGIPQRLAQEAIEEIFSFEPFKSFRDCFDIILITYVKPKRSDGVTVKEGSLYNTLNIKLGWTDWGNENNFDLCFTTTVWYIHTSKAISIPGKGKTTITHELGHEFAKLGDEYTIHNGYGKTHPDSGKNNWKEQRYYRANVAYVNDTELVPWSRFLKHPDYKGKVGIYEGASLYEFGAYRPSENSIMRGGEETEFNAPSRYAIYKEIMKRSRLLGDLRTPVDSNHFPPEIEEMLWEAFLEYDRINL